MTGYTNLSVGVHTRGMAGSVAGEQGCSPWELGVKMVIGLLTSTYSSY
jgi:hypothetical protein